MPDTDQSHFTGTYEEMRRWGGGRVDPHVKAVVARQLHGGGRSASGPAAAAGRQGVQADCAVALRPIHLRQQVLPRGNPGLKRFTLASMYASAASLSPRYFSGGKRSSQIIDL